MQTASTRAVPGTATLSGRVAGDSGLPRIRVRGPDTTATPAVIGGRWECSGLPPGRYLVELVADRTVLAREVELVAHREHFVDFRVRPR